MESGMHDAAAVAAAAEAATAAVAAGHKSLKQQQL